MEKSYVDGSSFWNPYEGLGAGANLIKLSHNWLKDGILQPALGSADDPVKALNHLEASVRALRPKVKFAMEECHQVQSKRKLEATPVQLSKDEVQVLHGLQQQVAQFRQMIANSSGKFAIGNLEIVYPSATIKFTTESYFDFVNRSIDETLILSKTGFLVGPSPNQSY